MTVGNHTARPPKLSNEQAAARPLPQRLSGAPGGPGAFAVPSRTLPDRRYRVTVATEGALCTCPGYRHRARCWHVGAVDELRRTEVRHRAARRLAQIAEEFAP